MITSLGIRIIAAWLLFLPVAVLNGLLREKIFKRFMKDRAAHQLSTLILICAFFGMARLMLGSAAGGLSTGALLAIGAFWVLCTMLFEFGFGHFVMHHPWERLLADYNLCKGRVWPLFLAAELMAPLAVGALMAR
jgi:hypothetical protein